MLSNPKLLVKFIAQITVCLAWLLFTTGPLNADEIFLKDGRVIEGEITSKPDADTLDIRVGAGGLVAVQHFSKHQIRSVKYGISARQEALDSLRGAYDTLLARADASAQDWWTLTRKLQDREVSALAKDAAAQTVMRERNHEDARRLLGMVRYRGVWMRPNEIAAARGEVFFRGAWVLWEVQQQTLDDENKRKDEAVAARKERDDQRRLARQAAAEATASRAVTIYPETYVSGYYRSPYYNPYGGWRYPVYGSGYPIQPIYGSIGGSYGYSNCATGGGIGWHVGASGGGSNNAWSFNWTGGSSIR